MNELQVIDNEFVTVYETDTGEHIVYARELHENLYVSTRFNDWINRNLLSVGFIEDEDFYSILSKTSGRPSQDYILTLDTAKHISMIQRTELGMKIRQKFIDLEKKPRLQKPQSQLEVLQGAINQMVEQEKRINDVELRVVKSEQRHDEIKEIMSLNPVEWRKKVNNLINKIAQSFGGYQAFQEIRQESYDKLEDRAGCKLSVRLSNKKRKMLEEGVANSRIKKVNKMDVIADDSRLTEIYLAIVKEMAIQYEVTTTLKEA